MGVIDTIVALKFTSNKIRHQLPSLPGLSDSQKSLLCIVMNNIAAQLDSILEEYLPKLHILTEGEFSDKPSPLKWSKKEIVGHLIDSAQANIRRFVVAQYENDPVINYDQDKWVNINNYQHQPTQQLVNLWYLLNKQVVSILENTSPEMAQRNCKNETLHSIEWLASDYNKHLKHHLHQVLGIEPVAYP